MLTKHSYYLLIVILLVFAVLSALLFSKFLAPLIIGALLAALGLPVYKKLLNVLKNRGSLAAFIVVSAMVLLIVVPAIFLVALIAKEAFDLLVFVQEEVKVGQRIAELEAAFSKFNLDLDIRSVAKNQLLPALQNFGLFISQQLGAILSNVISLFIGLLIVFVVTFYLLRDGHRLAEFLMKVSPLKTEDELFIFQTFKDVSGALFFGNFLIALLQGVLGTIGFWIFGFESPVLWGLAIGILALIPMLGASVVYVPAAIYLLVINNPTIAILFLIYNIIYSAVSENILKPKLISERMKVHPLLVLLSILGGIKIFGILGIIYGPLIVTIFLSLLKIYLAAQKGEALAR